MKRTTTAILSAILAASTYGQATEFSGTFYVQPSWTHVKSNGASVVTESIGTILEQSHTYGTNANQMTAFWRYVGTLTNSETRTFNLRAATNSFGDVLAFRRINFVAAKSSASNSANVEINGSDTDGTSLFIDDLGASVRVYPGGVVCATAPDIVGIAIETNACKFDVTNGSTNSATIELYFGGVTQ